MRWYPSKDMIKQSWEKYSLIIIGNIVFFALLYFISYRPNNDENRATEFLAMAQTQETSGRNEAAMVLYEKVKKAYPKSRAAKTATARLPKVKKLVASPPSKEPELVQPRLDLQSMLSKRPSVYLATFLAKHYHDDPSQTPKIREALNNYLQIATSQDGVDIKTLKNEQAFQTDFIKKEFFTPRPRCSIESDWIYDDFYVENTNFFPWRNVNIKLKVTQGDEKTEQEIRLPFVGPGEKVELLEFRVQKSEGVVKCGGDLTTTEGSTTWDQNM